MGTAATSANQSQQFKHVQAMEIRKERHSNVYHIATVPLPKKVRFLWGQPEPVHPDASVTQRQSSFASMESETLMPTLFCEDLSETQTRKMHKNDPMNSSNRQIWNNHQKTCTYNCQRPTSNSTCLSLHWFPLRMLTVKAQKIHKNAPRGEWLLLVHLTRWALHLLFSLAGFETKRK